MFVKTHPDPSSFTQLAEVSVAFILTADDFENITNWTEMRAMFRTKLTNSLGVCRENFLGSRKLCVSFAIAYKPLNYPQPRTGLLRKTVYSYDELVQQTIGFMTEFLQDNFGGLDRNAHILQSAKTTLSRSSMVIDIIDPCRYGYHFSNTKFLGTALDEIGRRAMTGYISHADYFDDISYGLWGVKDVNYFKF